MIMKINKKEILPILVLIYMFAATVYYAQEEDENSKSIEETTPIEQAIETYQEEESAETIEVIEPELAAQPVAKDLECLALNIYHESRSDSFAGRIAVADVVLNRVDSNLFPNTICEVVNQSVMRTNWKGNEVPVRGMCHFSWFCDGLSDEPMEEEAWEDAQIIAEMTLNSYGFRGITEGSTHYHATYVSPNWINDRGMVRVGRIGEHKFYRWH